MFFKKLLRKISLTRLGVDKVKPKGWFLGLWVWGLGIDNDVPVEDGGLLQVLPLTVHLIFFDRQVGGTILKLSYFLNFFMGPLLKA